MFYIHEVAFVVLFATARPSLDLPGTRTNHRGASLVSTTTKALHISLSEWHPIVIRRSEKFSAAQCYMPLACSGEQDRTDQGDFPRRATNGDAMVATKDAYHSGRYSSDGMIRALCRRQR